MEASTPTCLQPYDVLGVTPASSIAELRKNYFQLALVCHPDKGGNAEDMRVITSCYQWILAQLHGMEAKEHKTYEDAQASFDTFLEAQGAKAVPSVMDVVLESIGISKEEIGSYFDGMERKGCNAPLGQGARDWFVQMVCRDLYIQSLGKDVVDQNRVAEICSYNLERISEHWGSMYHASIPGGYGASMTDEAIAALAGQKELVVYREPVAAVGMQGASVEVPTSLDDYGIRGASDYQTAFAGCSNYEADAHKVLGGYQEPWGDVDVLWNAICMERKMSL